MKKIALLSATIATLGLATAAQAEYTGPGAGTPAPSTVAAVLSEGHDDQDVTLRGHLVKKVGKEKYIFADDSGKIRVDIDHDDFPNAAVDEKTMIEITGEIEKDFMESPEIDVDKLTIVK